MSKDLPVAISLQASTFPVIKEQSENARDYICERGVSTFIDHIFLHCRCVWYRGKYFSIFSCLVGQNILQENKFLTNKENDLMKEGKTGCVSAIPSSLSIHFHNNIFLHAKHTPFMRAAFPLLTSLPQLFGCLHFVV